MPIENQSANRLAFVRSRDRYDRSSPVNHSNCSTKFLSAYVYDVCVYSILLRMRSSYSSLSCRPDLWFLVYEFLDPWCAEWMVWIVLLLMEYFSLWNRSINMLECEECVYILSLLLKSLSVLYIDFYMWIILKLIMVLTRSFLFFFFFVFYSSFLDIFCWWLFGRLRIIILFWNDEKLCICLTWFCCRQRTFIEWKTIAERQTSKWR